MAASLSRSGGVTGRRSSVSHETVGLAIRLARSAFCRRLISWEDRKAARNDWTSPLEEGCTMNTSDDSQPPAWDVDGSEDLEEDPGEELEAMIEQADRPFASESFGTTAEEQ